MCEADAYIVNSQGEEEILLERVDKLTPEDGKILLENIYGQRRIVRARIKELALVDHRIVLEQVDE